MRILLTTVLLSLGTFTYAQKQGGLVTPIGRLFGTSYTIDTLKCFFEYKYDTHIRNEDGFVMIRHLKNGSDTTWFDHNFNMIQNAIILRWVIAPNPIHNYHVHNDHTDSLLIHKHD